MVSQSTALTLYLIYHSYGLYLRVNKLCDGSSAIGDCLKYRVTKIRIINKVVFTHTTALIDSEHENHENANKNMILKRS